jgi:hypothetical protein
MCCAAATDCGEINPVVADKLSAYRTMTILLGLVLRPDELAAYSRFALDQRMLFRLTPPPLSLYCKSVLDNGLVELF